jgi:polyphosphate kinase 2 (PPK2 family)
MIIVEALFGLPEKGKFAVFNRSHYENVLVECILNIF